MAISWLPVSVGGFSSGAPKTSLIVGQHSRMSSEKEIVRMLKAIVSESFMIFMMLYLIVVFGIFFPFGLLIREERLLGQIDLDRYE